MTLLELQQEFTNRLENLYPSTEIENFFFWVLEDILSLERIDFALQKTLRIETEKLTKIQKIIDRLVNEEPIQHILGYTEFFGLKFKVSKDTLIPRPETEELVEWILETLTNSHIKSPQILDIGTGSGCISIALGNKLKRAHITGVDISSEAIDIATQNATEHNINVDFKLLDILSTEELPVRYDIIVSNPPYVRELEKVEIQNNVLNYEPSLALFVSNNNPLVFYEKIADLAKNSLVENGLLFFEINQYLGMEMIAMLKAKGYQKIELRKDLFGNDRMICCTL